MRAFSLIYFLFFIYLKKMLLIKTRGRFQAGFWIIDHWITVYGFHSENVFLEKLNKNCNFEPFCFLINCVLLGKEHMYKNGFVANTLLINHLGTGKSLSEPLIIASTNPQYGKRLFIDLPVLT
jgi:hypothetical protein